MLVCACQSEFSSSCSPGLHSKMCDIRVCVCVCVFSLRISGKREVEEV